MLKTIFEVLFLLTSHSLSAALSQFAKTIALGNAIANSAQAPAERFLLPHIENVLPVEYKKWAQPVLTYTIKSIAGARHFLFCDYFILVFDTN